MSDSEEKTPTVSPDQGVTGEKVLFSTGTGRESVCKTRKADKWHEMG